MKVRLKSKDTDLKVILVGDMFRYSGAEISTLELHNALLQEGIKSKLFVPEFRNEQIRKNHVITFKVPFKSPSSTEDIYLKLGNPLFQFLMTRSLIQQISHFQPDLLHSSNFFSIPATWLASKLTKVPFISHIRDYRLVCSAEICFKSGEISFCGDYQRFSCLLSVTKNPLKAIYGVLIVKLMRHFFQGSKKILVTSNFLGRVIQRILKRKTVTLYNIVAVKHKPAKQRKNDRFHLLYCGRLNENKGLQLLLDIAKENDKDLLLHIAGKGELLDRVLKHVKDLENIVYHGFLPRTDLYDIIANVDLVAVPSLWPEPFGRIVVESQLIGVPVIASRKGGIPEILPPHCLFDPNKHDLLRKIEDFRESPDKFTSKVNIMLKPERIVKKLLKSYRECIGDNSNELSTQKTSLRLKEYYEKEAELTDIDERMYSTYFGKERYQKITQLMNQLNFSSLLDVGCGNGKYLIDKGVGVDISRGYLRQAKTRAKRKCLRVDLLQVDNTRLPFCSNSFDLALCSEVLEHTVVWQVALQELIRVSKKYILISVPGHTIFSIFQRDKSKSFDECGKGHLHDITPLLIKKLLDKIKAKVAVEHVHIFTHVPLQLYHLRFLDKFLRLIFKKRGLNQVILLKKQS